MTTQVEIEMILARQLASYLNIPIFLVDTAGNLLYYNESAEPILGRRFDETGAMSIEEWSAAFALTDDDGQQIPPEETPLTIALRECRPVHRSLWLCGLDNVQRHINATCLPLIGQADRFLGAIALFWETEQG